MDSSGLEIIKLLVGSGQACLVPIELVAPLEVLDDHPTSRRGLGDRRKTMRLLWSEFVSLLYRSQTRPRNYADWQCFGVTCMCARRLKSTQITRLIGRNVMNSTAPTSISLRISLEKFSACYVITGTNSM